MDEFKITMLFPACLPWHCRHLYLSLDTVSCSKDKPPSTLINADFKRSHNCASSLALFVELIYIHSTGILSLELLLFVATPVPTQHTASIGFHKIKPSALSTSFTIKDPRKLLPLSIFAPLLILLFLLCT